MKGVIFNVFNQMIEEKFGLETWQELIDKTNPSSGGIYTSIDTYSTNELFSMVVALSQLKNIPVEALVLAFGEYAFVQLAKLYPQFFKGKDIKQFLLSIHGHIHVEVEKLYPGAELPSFTYEEPSANQLVMIYSSPRKLCKLAEGLIEGADGHD